MAMQLEQRIVHSVLCEWGSYEEQQLTASAYSRINPLWRFWKFGDVGKPVFGSTVLHEGTPRQILSIKLGIAKLPHTQQEVLTAKYVFHVKPEGGLWSDQEKAELLGMKYGAYNTAVHRARSRLYEYAL